MIDHHGNKVKLFLKPGEMILYESAKIPHGRQYPLKGDFYDNLFVHFHPVDDSNLYMKSDKHAYFPAAKT